MGRKEQIRCKIVATKKLKVQKLGDSREKQERLRQHQEKFIKEEERSFRPSDRDYEKDSSIFGTLMATFSGSRRRDAQRSGIRRQRDKGEKSRVLYARKSRDRERLDQSRGRKCPQHQR